MLKQSRLIRIIKPIKGKPIINVNYDPKVGYASGYTVFNEVDGNLIASDGKTKLSLISNVDFDIILKEEFFKLDHTKYFVIGNPDNAIDFSVTKCLKLLTFHKHTPTWH